jgi:hypothetical protein
MRQLLSLFLAIASAGCLRNTVYSCDVDTDCGNGGVCDQGLKLCSIADPNCDSGFRYSDTAGDHANQCVGGGVPMDGPPDMPPPGDGDAPPADCPSDFMQLPGGSAHTYFVITKTDTWVNQNVACKAKSTRATLAIPKTTDENLALTTFVGAGPAAYWIGIDDIDMNGIWNDATGVQATFDGVPVTDTQGQPPWQASEPDSQAGSGLEHCVNMSTSVSKWNDGRCDVGNLKLVAVCECTP